jgi:hypothetical protein
MSKRSGRVATKEQPPAERESRSATMGKEQ